MRPDSSLASLLGHHRCRPAPSADGYLKVDTATAPGAGIVADTIQFHGTADRYTALAGATGGRHALLERHHGHDQPGRHPAQRRHNGGQAAAFTFDLPALDRADPAGQPGLGGH